MNPEHCRASGALPFSRLGPEIESTFGVAVPLDNLEVRWLDERPLTSFKVNYIVDRF